MIAVPEDVRYKAVRVAALTLLRSEVPGAPAAAVGPPSRWWTQAEEVYEVMIPYVLESLNGDV